MLATLSHGSIKWVASLFTLKQQQDCCYLAWEKKLGCCLLQNLKNLNKLLAHKSQNRTDTSITKTYDDFAYNEQSHL